MTSVTVTLHISEKSPTIKHPDNISLTTCSGVFISPNEILTANHCIAESRGHQWIKTSDGNSYSVSIEKNDKYKDLALLKIDNKNFVHKYVYLGNPINKTEAVYTINSGNGLAETYNQGIVNNIITDDEYGTLSIIHNAIILPGASGSGLFNSRGQLIGINVAVIRSLSEATDILEIKAFLNVRN